MESNKNKLNEKGLEDLDSFNQHYLGKQAKAVAKLKPYLIKTQAVKEMIRSMSYLDIRWNREGQAFYPILPDNIMAAISELRLMDAAKTQSDFGVWSTLTSKGNIYMKCERNDMHRSHFPNNGIPVAVRGLGLGSKLYRALIEHEKYVTSSSSATTEAQRAWQSVIKKKADPAEDIHVILAPSDNVLAMIKTIPDTEKIRIVKIFLSNVSTDSITTRNFAIDPELKAIMPTEVQVLIDPARREEAARIRQEQQDRERAAREIRQRQEQRTTITAYGINPDVEFDHNWNVGDYIVIKDYLLRQDYTEVPIRKVVAMSGDQYIALSVEDVAAYDAEGRTNNTRSTTGTPNGKAAWIKINILQVNVDRIGSSTANKRAVRELQTAISRGDSSTSTTTHSTPRPTAPNNVQNAYTGTIEVFQGRKDQFQNRTRMVPSVRRKIKESEYFYLVGDQIDKYRSNQTCEVCIATQRGNTPIKLFSTVTHQVVETTFRSEDELKQFASRNPHVIMLIKVTRLAAKTDLRSGEMMYVAKHNTLMGIAAPVDYYLLNSAQNREFVYVKAYSRYNERGSYDRTIRYKVPIRLDYAKKIEVVLAESIKYMPSFGTYIDSLQS